MIWMIIFLVMVVVVQQCEICGLYKTVDGLIDFANSDKQLWGIQHNINDSQIKINENILKSITPLEDKNV